MNPGDNITPELEQFIYDCRNRFRSVVAAEGGGLPTELMLRGFRAAEAGPEGLLINKRDLVIGLMFCMWCLDNESGNTPPLVKDAGVEGPER